MSCKAKLKLSLHLLNEFVKESERQNREITYLKSFIIHLENKLAGIRSKEFSKK